MEVHLSRKTTYHYTVSDLIQCLLTSLVVEPTRSSTSTIYSSTRLLLCHFCLKYQLSQMGLWTNQTSRILGKQSHYQPFFCLRLLTSKHPAVLEFVKCLRSLVFLKMVLPFQWLHLLHFAELFLCCMVGYFHGLCLQNTYRIILQDKCLKNIKIHCLFANYLC